MFCIFLQSQWPYPLRQVISQRISNLLTVEQETKGSSQSGTDRVDRLGATTNWVTKPHVGRDAKNNSQISVKEFDDIVYEIIHSH